MMALEYSYTLDQSHWFKYVTTAQRNMRSAAKGPGRGRMAGLFALAILFVVVGAWLVQRGFGPAQGLAFSAGSVGAWVLLTAYLVQYQRQTYRNGLKADGIILGPKTLTIDDSGLVLRGRAFEQRYHWDSIDAVEEAGEIVVVWFEPIVGTFIPTATFGGADGVKAFRAAIEQHITRTGR